MVIKNDSLAPFVTPAAPAPLARRAIASVQPPASGRPDSWTPLSPGSDKSGPSEAPGCGQLGSYCLSLLVDFRVAPGQSIRWIGKFKALIFNYLSPFSHI
jgi:hypothetical protein